MPNVATKDSTFEDGASYIQSTQQGTVKAGGSAIATEGDPVYCRFHYYDDGWYAGMSTIDAATCSQTIKVGGRKVAKVGSKSVCGHATISSGCGTVNVS